VSTSDGKGHIVELQSLRGIAAIAVMIGHVIAFYNQPLWVLDASRVFNGRAAVVLFFVLSGFVLTKALQSSTLEPRALVKFYVRRLARIYPAIWAVSALGLLYLIFLHWTIPTTDMSAFFQARFRPDRMDLLHITASFAGGLAFIVPQLWSIFVEIVASFALPFIVYAAFHKRAMFYLAFALAFVVSVTIGPKTYYHLGLYGVDFFVGVELAILGERGRRMFAMTRPIASWLMAACGLGLTFSLFLQTNYYSPWAAALEAVLAAGLIGLVVHSGVEVRALKSRVALFLGDISYSLYLLHFLVACLVVKAIALFERAANVDIPLVSQGLLLVALTVALTIPFSWLMYERVEKWGIGFGKRLAARVAQFGHAPAPARV
jgi:peptidoglycan/LPS O-acetylase OafA/YrhL